MITETRHTDREYEHELARLRDRLLQMAERVEGMIRSSLVAVVEGDVQLAERTIHVDDEVNADEVEIDDACLSLLARRQPMASDLRFIALALKMVTDLERVGDLAVSLCERAIALADTGARPLPQLRELEEIGERVQRMMRAALDALERRDAVAARAVIAADEQVDELYHHAMRELFMTMMSGDPSMITTAVHLQTIAKLLERIGDHATNVAEHVVFLVDATDIRHAAKKRVTRRTRG